MSILPPLAGINRFHVAGVAAALAVVPLVSACAARSEPPAPVELTGSYLIEGSVGGRMLRGTLSFPAGGGYVFINNAAVCDETDSNGVFDLRRQLRGGHELEVHCGGFSVEIDFVDGGLAETGLASRVQSESFNRTTTCAQYDENGNCIRYNISSGRRSSEREGVVTVTPVSGG